MVCQRDSLSVSESESESDNHSELPPSPAKKRCSTFTLVEVFALTITILNSKLDCIFCVQYKIALLIV